jgi:hypothetical protein
MSIRVLLYGAKASGDSRPAGSLMAHTESIEMTTAPTMKLTPDNAQPDALGSNSLFVSSDSTTWMGWRGRIRHRLRLLRGRGAPT